MKIINRLGRSLVVLILAAICGLHAPITANGQSTGLRAIDTRTMFLDWLQVMKDAIKSEYYDPKFRGMSLDARFDTAKTSIKSLDYDWQMFSVLSELLMDLDDSHTYLILPPRKNYFDYGFSVQMVGNVCLITSVTKDSGAEKAGLEVGDRIVKFGNIEPDRPTLWKILYVLDQLDPSETIEVAVKKEGAPEKIVKVPARILSRKEYLAERKRRKDDEKSDAAKCTPMNADIISCKLYTFNAEHRDIDKMMKMVAGHKKLIMDLRGNSGGSVDTEQYLTGYFFDRNVKILDLVKRKKTEALIAKSKGEKAFMGELIVLVDSDSASASEVFARIIQIEKRGKVIGDFTSGSVMTSIPVALVLTEARFGYKTKVFPLGMSLTIGDVVMSDGGRLEQRGVKPDILLIPAASDLKRGADPVLARASTMLGHDLTPEDAGKMRFMRPTRTHQFEISDQ